MIFNICADNRGDILMIWIGEESYQELEEIWSKDREGMIEIDTIVTR